MKRVSLLGNVIGDCDTMIWVIGFWNNIYLSVASHVRKLLTKSDCTKDTYSILSYFSGKIPLTMFNLQGDS